MRRGFVTHELLSRIAIIAIAIGLCLPIVAAMRSSRLTSALGIGLIAAICLLILIPWVYSERAGRRRMKELDAGKDDPKDP